MIFFEQTELNSKQDGARETGMWGGWHFPFKGCRDKTIIVKTRQSGKVLQGRGGFLEKKQDGGDCGGDTYVYANRGGGDLPRWRSANRDVDI